MLNIAIFNKYEKITYERLEKVCTSVNASVFPKVRLADIFSITNSGISNEDYSFALKSHFDFTVYDNKSLLPLFAVEFDGKFHRTETQKFRDEIKNRLVKRFDLPLLRINSLYLEEKYRNLDLLSWCVEVWFLAEYFYEAQENGTVPYDEPFAPESIFSLSGNEKKFPFFLSFDIKNEIRKLSEKKQIKSLIPNTWIGTDNNGNYYGISWLYIDNETGVFTTSGIKAQRFPVSESELLEEIMIFDLYEQLLGFFNNKRRSVMNREIFKRINEFEKKYRIALVSSGGARED
ncbi:DUF2726 domain-containing protein [Bacillus pseudomycoides]|uniref:DUF2726 domain-containing protein n=1 Tax=Bacillus pseudomycoides TaxID=64104 RepID=UPI000BEE7936|nr:DUF2726 domain-containing protein [Bacillus pseudomycoides]PED69294.1 hypothetical protein CON97_25970 [Bacillus pseudomycoides]PHB28533.1 hypothetical protein COE85_00195 [Bacillus pseudomycoides]